MSAPQDVCSIEPSTSRDAEIFRRVALVGHQQSCHVQQQEAWPAAINVLPTLPLLGSYRSASMEIGIPLEYENDHDSARPVCGHLLLPTGPLLVCCCWKTSSSRCNGNYERGLLREAVRALSRAHQFDLMELLLGSMRK